MEAGGYGNGNRSRQAAYTACCSNERRRNEDDIGIIYGKVVCQRSRGEVCKRRCADSRRIRVYQRLSSGKVLSRRKAVHDRRRHERDTEIGDSEAVAEGLVFEQLAATVADMQNVHRLIFNGEENPIHVRSMTIEQMAHFKGEDSVF